MKRHAYILPRHPRALVIAERHKSAVPETIGLRDSVGLLEDASALTAMAEDLGREIFGERFRPSDFQGGLG